ncbi:hypothetical protein N7532_011233 [Penicillium argentinense]|uniref:Phytanoyl-CoA dioxygenase family protein n=1 Tax=Penicillium argentinense TaxID=1131581 RepID=A0A9W9EI61_9EURO|nr:uncharacterized protein N7532_011233 [Penicillium argentinense]KAJ5082190.1 hypothetical protein N7532_011233 [Penicillium argentinense]
MHPFLPSTLQAAKKSLQTSGYAIIPNVLSESDTTTILTRLWAAAETNRLRGADLYIPALDPNASNIRIFYLLELDPIFRSLIQHPGALALVKEILGPDILVSNFTANIARPGSGSMALHSDQSLIVPEPWEEAWALNIIWCLSDVYFENGATLFIPGSQNWKRKADVPGGAEEMLEPFVAEKGSIIALDARVWHTSGCNVTKDQDRELLFGFYTRPFLRQQVNWTAVLGEDVKEELGEVGRELLGLNVTANTGVVSDVGIGLEEFEAKE